MVEFKHILATTDMSDSSGPANSPPDQLWHAQSGP